MTRVPSIRPGRAMTGGFRRGASIVWYADTSHRERTVGVTAIVKPGTGRATLAIQEYGCDLECPPLMALASLATIEVACEPEHDDPAGHFDGDEADQIVAEIRLRREFNKWAWCMVRVRATFGPFVGESSYLGACSYDSENDFRRQGDYFDDLRAEALDALHAAILAGHPCHK